ncbi:MAG: ATP phosphoribosyltransferase regulatory subunit, partial [bacterium]
EEGCQNLKADAPNLMDKLCTTCSAHFRGVLEHLDELQISYMLDNHLVRGFDYYSRTVFEIFVSGPGGEVGAIISGGRYDYLMEMIGGHLTPAVGGSLGIERTLAVMRAKNVMPPAKTTAKKVFVAHAGDSAKRKALKLMADLVRQGIPVTEALSKDSLKAQLKVADKGGVAVALILGQKEIYEECVIIRDMRTGLQDSVPLDKIVVEIKKRWRQ